MENKQPINEVIGVTMEKIKQMVDVNTIVGEPINTPQGVTVIPISKVSVGFGSGGTDFNSKHQPTSKNFGGGAVAGLNIDPVAFLIIRNDNVRLVPVAPGPGGPVEKVIDLMPEIVDKVTGFVDQRRAAKEANNITNAE